MFLKFKIMLDFKPQSAISEDIESTASLQFISLLFKENLFSQLPTDTHKAQNRTVPLHACVSSRPFIKWVCFNCVRVWLHSSARPDKYLKATLFA